MCGEICKIYNFITTYYKVCTQLHQTIYNCVGCVGRDIPV